MTESCFDARQLRLHHWIYKAKRPIFWTYNKSYKKREPLFTNLRAVSQLHPNPLFEAAKFHSYLSCLFNLRPIL